MKRLLFFLMATLFAMQGFSQATLNEGFEGTTFPPDDWRIETTSGGGTWVSSTSIAHGGTKSAKSGFYSGGCTRWLITPKLTVTATETNFSFWIACDDWYSDGDNIDVFVSTTDNSTSSFGTTALLALTEDNITTSWAQHTVDLSTFIGQDIYVAIRVTDNFGFNTFIDDVTGPELFVPACPKPTALSASNPTTTGIDLGWTDDTGLIWNIEYMLATETDWTNATTLYSVMNPHTFTSLNASTSYKARVQTDCGTEQSDWTSPITFMTACDAITVLPYSDSFDTYGTVSGSFPPCWSRPVLNTTTPYPSINTTNHTPPASIRFQSESATQPTYVITPQFADDINTLRLKFWLKAENTTSSGTMQVGVMSDPLDLTTFELVATIAPSTTAWTEYEYLFSGTTLTGPNNYIAFKHVTVAYNYYYWLDDVVVDYIPSCPKPTALTASNPTTIGIDLGWTDDVGSLWNIQYMLNSETDWANATTISGVSNPYTFTTLNPSTVYKARVQTDCGTEQSEWSSVITFATACGAITTFPWTEGFEVAWSPAVSPGNTPAPNCWTNINKGAGSTNLWSRGTTTHSGTGAAQMYTDNSSQNNDWLITPLISLTGNERLRFWAMNYSSTSSEVDEISIWISDGIITSIDTTNMGQYDSIQGFTQIYQTGIPIGNWQQYEINLNQYSGDRYIAFVRRNTPNNGYYLRLDDVEISELPTCMRPTNLIVSSISTTGAEISWVNGSSADASWWLYYKQGSATDFDSIQINSNPYLIQSFIPSSSYQIYLKTDCSVEVSEASNTVSFQTLCESIDGLTDLPWNEGFEGITANNQLPACWSATNLGTYTYTQIANYNSYNRNARTGTKSAYFRYGANDKFVTPIFNLYAGQSYDFSFWYVTDGLSGWNNLKAQVRPVSNPTAVQTIGTPIAPVSNTTYELYLGMFTPPADGLYEFTIECQADGNPYYLTIDDISLSVTPDCPNVYGLTAEPASTSSVSVNWDNSIDDGTGFNVAYASNVVGTFDPATSMIIPIPSGTTLPYTIPGFNPGDSIWVAVQRGCLGNWTEAQKINLPEFANQLPLIADFEDALLDDIWTITNGTQTNKWYIGVPGANDSDPTDGIDERGLYISSDNGATATYSSASSSIVFVSTLVEFDNSPAFELSFDWANYGEIDWHDLNVYLMPLSIALTPGTLPNSQYQINTASLAEETSFHTFTRVFDGSYSNSVKQLVFAWQNDDYGNYNPPARVDNISLVAFTCGMPYGLAMDSASYNGTDVYLSWTEPQGATSWIVEYQQTGTSSWNQVAATTNPLTLTGLNPGTAYQARVRTICDGSDTSSASNLISFLTECITMTVPTPVEPFFAVPPSICWSKMSGLLPATGNAILSTTTSGWLLNSNVTPNNAKVNLYGTSCKYWLVSPSIDLGDGSTTSQIEFDLFFTDYGNVDVPDLSGTDDRFAVVVSLDNGTTWNATNATIWSNAVGATKVLNNIPNIPTHIIIPLFDSVTSLPLSGIVKIGFYGESTATNADNDMHIDNFEVRPYSTCQRPTGLIATNVTSTDATIHFTENGTSTAWEYVYGDATTITDPTTGTPISITEDSILLIGLSPQTQYKVWVRSQCGSENSDWSDFCLFVTEAIPALTPYTFGFEDATENLAWKSLSGTQNKWAIGTAAGNGNSATGTQAYYISPDNGLTYGTNVGNNYAYTYRDIDFGTDSASYRLTFDWKCQGYVSGNSVSSGIIVLLRDPVDPIITSGLPDDPNNNIGLFYNGTTWQTEDAAIDNVAGIKRLIFFYWDGYTPYSPPAAIDNISIIEEACPRPFNLLANNITPSSAEISWSHPGADSYIVSYRAIEDSVLIHDASLSSPLTISNLSSGTPYVFAVRSICSGDTSMYSESEVFSTPCVTISTFPWTEGFESGLMCWTISSSVTSANWKSISSGTWPTATPHSGSNMIMFNSNSISSGEWSTLYSPLLDFPNDQYQISFWLFRDNADYLTTADRVELYVNSTASETGATLLGTVNRSFSLAPIETSGGWYQYTFNLPAGMTGNNYVMLKGISSYGRNVYVDDLMVDGLGDPCPPPTNITVTPSNISANVTWTAGDAETSWEVRLGTTGTPEVTSITNHPLTELTPSTTYTVYVRANCGTGYSSWIPKQFTTTDVPTPPTVTTAVPTTMISQTTAVFNGTYVQTTDAILTKGFEYKTAAATTWTNEVVTDGTTPFTFSPTGLIANTAYEVKAYVTTATFNTTYGNTVAFTTLAIVPPTVTTDSVKVLSETSATFYGKITQNTESIEARGFEYKLSSQAWADAINISATGVTTISATPTTLTTGSYNVRAYARTLAGTEYGQVLTFQTSGIDGIDGKEISIMMYPNPATSQTNLIVSGINGETKIILSDVQGRTLNTINAKPVSGKIEQTIDLNNLAKGVYYIRIQNSDINRTQKLIVK